MDSHFILYVSSQARATAFYRAVLGMAPRLDVPGMTEFQLSETAVLGLMPEAGVERLLGDIVRGPGTIVGKARAELYLLVDDPAACHERALRAGARELSPPAPRDWGDVAAYSMDLDGHVLAFAKRLTASS